MRYAIAIDVGIKNLGICVFDFCDSRIVHWDNVTLVSNGRYQPCKNVQYVRDFVKQYEHFFENASHVLVERQMRCNMRIVEAVLQTMFFERCVIINARCIKLHYGLSMKNYRLNKKRAIEWAKSFVEANDSVAFAEGVASAFQEQKKQDDLADSLLMLCYFLDTYSNQLQSDTVLQILHAVQ